MSSLSQRHRRAAAEENEMALRFVDSEATDATDTGGDVRAVPIASPSPLDTPTVSGEDDDYRSETSSETTTTSRYSRGSNSYGDSDGIASDGTKRRCKQTTSAYSNHRDLSLRLKRAVHNALENVNFDEHLIGADVVLCVVTSSSARRFRETTTTDSDTATTTGADTTDAPPTVTRFHAHRFILAASSEPFRAMLTGRMREASQRDVELHSVEPHIVEKMLLFIYTGGASAHCSLHL